MQTDVQMDQIAGGGYHVCGVLSDTKQAHCWGRNSDNQTDIPADLVDSAFAKVVAGGYHSCGLSIPAGQTSCDAEGCELHCWGSDSGAPDNGQVSSRPSGRFVDVEAGAYHTCATKWGNSSDVSTDETGVMVCWGQVLGSSNSIIETRVAYTEHPCLEDILFEATEEGCTEKHKLEPLYVQYCAADPETNCPYFKPLGFKCNGPLVPTVSTNPRDIRNNPNGVPDCSETVPTCCKVFANQGYKNKGDNNYRNPRFEHHATYSDFTLGNAHNCGIIKYVAPPPADVSADDFQKYVRSKEHPVGGHVECWGSDEYGAITYSSAVTNGYYTEVSAGAHHTCAITAEGTTRCWGSNAEGQTDVPAAFRDRIVHLAAGWYHTCGVLGSNGLDDAEDEVVCWGRNDFGQAKPTSAEHISSE